MSAPRTYLYVPGHRGERFTKAITSGADAVILDLEDAVPLSAKDRARDDVAAFIGRTGAGPVETWVRINADERGMEDLAAVAAEKALAGVFVPKASVESLAKAHAAAPQVRLGALVESASAVVDLSAIATAAAVDRLALGEVDLCADLRIAADASDALWPLRMQVVVAAAAAGLQAPIGPVHLDVGDLDGLRTSTVLLSRGGFWSRQAIHPSQVPVIHECFKPSRGEVERALRLVELAGAAEGGVCVDDAGCMVDEAVLRSARQVLDMAGRFV